MSLSAIRRGAAISIAVVALGASAVACGSSGSSDDKGSEGDSKKPAAGKDKDSDSSGDNANSDQGAGATGPLSTAELTKRIVTKADMTGPLKGYTVAEPGAGEVDTSGGMKASANECQPLIDTLNDVAPAGADKTVRRAVTGPKEKRLEEGLGSQVALSSYKDETKAKQALDNLTTAVNSCSDGFGTTGKSKDEEQTFNSVDTKPQPKGADQAVSYALIGDIAEGQEVAEGQSTEMPMLFTYARSGSTVSMFITYNPFNPKKTAFPQGLVEAQIKKLTS